MAKPDSKRNTDVPATIAGFYYQIVIACREICQDHVKEVGIENGADIAIIYDNSQKTYIEAKLHGAKFSRFSEDIQKTIYNFYNSYEKTNQVQKMIFTTNTDISNKDKVFFTSWGTVSEEEIRYIQEAVLRKSIESHDTCKKNYEKFCLILQKSGTKTKKELLDELLKEVFEKKVLYSYADYAVVNDECSYEEFIQKLKFNFENEEKTGLLKKIEKEAKEKIKKDYLVIPENAKQENLSEDGAEYIFCQLVKMFFDCVTQNSQRGTRKNILVTEYQRCLVDYCQNKVVERDVENIKQCLAMLAYDEEEVIDDLDLEKKEDKYYIEECYAKVKQIFLEKIREEKGSLGFMERYLFKESMKKQSNQIGAAIIALLNALAVILYEERISVDDIKLFFDKDLDNLEIVGKLSCCYKKSYGKITMTKIVGAIIEDWEMQKDAVDKPIIVVDGEYYTEERPCDKKELFPEVYNIAQTDENYKDYLFYESLNFKCANCFKRNSKEYLKFWEGGGGLCKKV